MARQSIGLATLSAQKKDSDLRRQNIIESLRFLLSKLYPASPEKRILMFITKVVDKSISLRNAMTEEQAIYRCYFQDNGDIFERLTTQIASGEQESGNV